jgi:hypothetical protein
MYSNFVAIDGVIKNQLNLITVWSGYLKNMGASASYNPMGLDGVTGIALV